MTRVRVGNRRLELSNLDKVLFPDDGITKGQVIDYYRAVAEFMLPHLRDRPLTLQRFPDGIGAEGFFQQQRAEHFPDWLRSVALERAGEGDAVEHVLCATEADLVYLANQAVITFHGWLSLADRPERPDRLVFDLDPSGDDFGAVRTAAQRVAALLREVGLTPYPMTTGSRGLHVIAPLERSSDFDAVRDFARAMANHLAAEHPGELTVEQRKDKRGRRVYLDVLRNAYGQSTVAPYSLRGRPGAPVATPLDWDEVADSGLSPRGFNLNNLHRRLGQKPDPWQGMASRRACANAARQRFEQAFAG